MKMTKVLTSLVATAALSATAAYASPNIKTFNYRCSPGAIRSCASLEVVTQQVGTQTNVIIRVRNWQGGPSWLGDNTGGSVITRIGIVVPPITGPSVTNNTLTVTTSGGASAVNIPVAPLWFLRDPGIISSAIELTAGITNTGNNGGIVGCNAPFGGYPSQYYQTCGGGFVEFAFTTNNIWFAQNAELAWLERAEVANQGGGLECGTNNSNNVRPWCTEITPEPVTMVLLGSGLAGMGGLGFFRRRKNTEIENG